MGPPVRTSCGLMGGCTTDSFGLAGLGLLPLVEVVSYDMVTDYSAPAGGAEYEGCVHLLMAQYSGDALQPGKQYFQGIGYVLPLNA